MSAAPRTISFVTVVFEPEIALLRLQARSLARFLDEACVAEIVVLDNFVNGMRSGTRRRLLAEFGPALAPRVSIIRTSKLGVHHNTEGWRSQQAAKLLIAKHIDTEHYVILDAKNHLIAPASIRDFVDDTGRALGRTHPYSGHPLRGDLERTLRHLGADDAEVARALQDFPPTATPFVMETSLVLRMIRGVESAAAAPFAIAFERARLLEFFLYAGWSILREHRVPINGAHIPAAIIWPSRATEQGASDAIREVDEASAHWFSVHRRVLVRADAATRQRIIDFWVSRGLMDTAEAGRFVRSFRRAYVPAVARARIAERLSGLGGR
ncbi:DUF6492 family protein [Agrococcus sp. Ld7]|uniref:DUF6492 family protein n=1 Tax=Agrococcus sp. Ld7 TaxID=649148 RepID=UPI00386DDCF1